MKKPTLLLLFLFLLLFTTCASAESRRMKHLAGFIDFLAAVQEDGTVKATGNNEFGQCDTSSWRDVVAVAAGFNHTLGLKTDGTVYAAGDNNNGQCNVQDWTDIVMIAAGLDKSIGLRSDGTVVFTGWSYEDVSQLNSWHDIVWVGADWSLCGIDKDGNVFGTFEFDVSGFHDAVQVYEDSNITYALTRDGRVQVTSEFYDNYETVHEISAEHYDNICEIGGCGSYFAVLRQDGTADCDASSPFIEDWTDIVEIEDIFGVMSDGSVVYVMEGYMNDFTPEQLDEISTWKVMVDTDRALALGNIARDNPDLLLDTLTTMGGIALKAHAVGLEPGSHLAVYSGPGEGFLRGGNGKALLGTGEKLLLYGADHGWALIQYAVSKEKRRFGYIPLDALPERYMDIRLLPPVNLIGQAERAAIIRDTFVTDDPNASRDVLASLRSGRKDVMLLGTLGGNWAYVQAADEKGTVYRGFVPAADIASTGEAAVQAYAVPEGTVKLYAEGSKSPERYDAGEKYDVIPINAQTVVLPASADDIWELNILSRLERIQVPYSNTFYKSIGGVLFSKDGERLLLYPAGRVVEEYAPPEGTKHIDSPLSNAPALKSLILPSTVTDLPNGSNLSTLQALHTVPGNPAFSSRDGVLFSKDGTELVFYPPARPGDTYTAPEGVKNIGGFAFPPLATNLRHVILPDSLKVIDGGAFEGCESLESVYIPNGVLQIGVSAFENCTRLTTVNIPSSLTVIEAFTFASSGLSGMLVIPEGVVSIEDEAFFGVYGLTDLYLPASLTYMYIPANLILNEDGDPSSVTIHAPTGSYAAKIAAESGYDFVIEEP